MEDYYIGLMSGTSIDAIDACLIQTSNDSIRTIASYSLPFDTKLRDQLNDLCVPGDNEIERIADIENPLTDAYAQAVQQLLNKVSISSDQIRAIGCHGQTIRHRPEKSYTLQLVNPSRLAINSGIATISDFRRADMAVGGQGAPLVPLFHQYLFADPNQIRVILNLGGIANITALAPNKPPRGWDTGPANGLMNQWIKEHQSLAYDANGDWAAGGQVDSLLLDALLDDDYFKLAPPKSTGREYFNLAWLNERFQHTSGKIDPQNIQTSLCELSAQTIAEQIKQHVSNAQALIVCGGGVHNQFLMQRIKTHLPSVNIKSAAEYAVDPDFVEAACFAWLAKQHVQQHALDMRFITGQQQPVILGGYYPPKQKSSI
ncbi:MAG: anhydro-N-acetylmuramic acid kinase [Gammaproteobacteria bacterium]|nr:anhydro-N-acetylmuramic acid kinase [Gammaproteobacteria bacterium]MDH5727565.1 anhydro-N-acetylmuramic acid kinase [Gammaproteobacteria bacterium]